MAYNVVQFFPGEKMKVLIINEDQENYTSLALMSESCVVAEKIGDSYWVIKNRYGDHGIYMDEEAFMHMCESQADGPLVIVDKTEVGS